MCNGPARLFASPSARFWHPAGPREFRHRRSACRPFRPACPEWIWCRPKQMSRRGETQPQRLPLFLVDCTCPHRTKLPWERQVSGPARWPDRKRCGEVHERDTRGAATPPGSGAAAPAVLRGQPRLVAGPAHTSCRIQQIRLGPQRGAINSLNR